MSFQPRHKLPTPLRILVSRTKYFELEPSLPGEAAKIWQSIRDKMAETFYPTVLWTQRKAFLFLRVMLQSVQVRYWWSRDSLPRLHVEWKARVFEREARGTYSASYVAMPQDGSAPKGPSTVVNANLYMFHAQNSTCLLFLVRYCRWLVFCEHFYCLRHSIGEACWLCGICYSFIPVHAALLYIYIRSQTSKSQRRK